MKNPRYRNFFLSERPVRASWSVSSQDFIKIRCLLFGNGHVSGGRDGGSINWVNTRFAVHHSSNVNSVDVLNNFDQSNDYYSSEPKTTPDAKNNF